MPILDQLDGQDEDLSLTMYLGHTDKFLFLGYDVTDDFLDLDEGAAPFRNDSIEVLIDADLDETDVDPDGAGRNWGLEGMQLIADAAGEGDIFLNNRFSAGNGPVPIDDGEPLAGEFYSAGLTTDTGYVVEFQIPLGSLDTEDGPGETAATTGDVLRMNNSITDNDDQGANTQDCQAVVPAKLRPMRAAAKGTSRIQFQVRATFPIGLAFTGSWARNLSRSWATSWARP